MICCDQFSFKNSLKTPPYLAREGEEWGVICEWNVWLKFYHCIFVMYHYVIYDSGILTVFCMMHLCRWLIMENTNTYLAIFINSLWSSDAMWHHRTLSTLVQVKAWCPMAPSHSNQCLLIISKVLWHSPMMTSSNGNIFHVTGHLCGEFTGHRWISRTKASDTELWCFLWSAPE